MIRSEETGFPRLLLRNGGLLEQTTSDLIFYLTACMCMYKSKHWP